MPALAIRPRSVQPGDTVDHAAIQRAAKKAAGDRKQNVIADDLGVTPAAVSLALNKVGARYVKLQARIIERYTGLSIHEERTVVYRVTGEDRG